MKACIGQAIFEESVMRSLPVVVLLAVPILLSGCPDQGETKPDPDPDGVTCAHSAGAKAVRIDIVSYQEGPKGNCEVDRGTVITWRARTGEPRPFMLEFAGTGPGGPSAPRTYSSRDRGDRQALSLQADAAPGTYPYKIKVDGVEIDPAIIIR